MRVLVDSSVWVGHFKNRNDGLVALLEAGRVVCHPHVVLEVACGTPPRRRQIIGLLQALDSAPMATHEEMLTLIERRFLQGRGCGCVDVSLLAAVLLGGPMLLWTLDRRLDALAAELGRAFTTAGSPPAR